METFIHISSCGPCILAFLYFCWSIKTWNTVIDFADLRPLVPVLVHNLWDYSASFIGFQCAAWLFVWYNGNTVFFGLI